MCFENAYLVLCGSIILHSIHVARPSRICQSEKSNRKFSCYYVVGTYNYILHYIFIGEASLNKTTYPFGPLSFLLEDLGRKLAPIIIYIVAIDNVTAVTTAAVLISLKDAIMFHLQDFLIIINNSSFAIVLFL